MGKREKHLKRNLGFYKINFNFKPPYYVLIDGTFCKAALKYKVNIMEQLPKYLDGEVKYYTTKCVLAECEALGTLLYGPLKVLQQFQVLPCKHDSPLTPTKCLRATLKTMKKQKKQYMIATQDSVLTNAVREMSGVPLLYLFCKTVTLEEPREVSLKAAENKMKQKINPSQHQLQKIKQLKAEAFGEVEEKKKRKKKSGNPNPLSCKPKSKNPKKKKKMKKHKKTKMTLDAMLNQLSSSSGQTTDS